MTEPLKSSIGIWAFGPLATRYLPDGYHPQVARESPVERARRVAHGLHDLYDGLEFHYPIDINEEIAADVVAAIKPMDVYCISSGAHAIPGHARGALTHPDTRVRQDAREANRRAIDLAAEIGAHFIIWPGIDGYNYPFQSDYAQQWDLLLDGIGDAIDHANSCGVPVLLEHKNSEAAMKVYVRDVGIAMFVIRKLERMGIDVSRTKIDMDWQHLIMGGGSLAEYVELLAMEGLLGHQHANSGWGVADDDNVVGATRFMETLEIARSLRKVGYGMNGERLGFDLYPLNEDPIMAARQSLIQWGFIYDLCIRLDDAALEEAQREKDALAAYRVVFQTLGMDAASARLIAGGQQMAAGHR